MTTTTTVTAKGRLGDRDIEAQAVNPGGWFGKVWLLEVGGGFTPLYFAVEADSVSDAVDEFLDWEEEHGTTHIRLDPDDDAIADDYGDRIWGHDSSDPHPGPGWVNLRGEFIPEGDERGRYISEVRRGGNHGIAYDSDHLMIHGEESHATAHGDGIPWPCRYHHPALEHTPEGIDPRDWDVIDESRLD